jgi:hypothetical protein
LLELLEPWCDRIYIDDEMQVITTHYFDTEQANTAYDLTKRVLCIGHNDPEGENDIVVQMDGKRLSNQDFAYVQHLTEIIQDSGELGTFRLGGLNITIQNLQSYENDLIVCKQ